jgi:hypothetical protein
MTHEASGEGLGDSQKLAIQAGAYNRPVFGST